LAALVASLATPGLSGTLLLPGIGNLFEGVEEIRCRVATEFGSRLNDEPEREQHAPDAPLNGFDVGSITENLVYRRRERQLVNSLYAKVRGNEAPRDAHGRPELGTRNREASAFDDGPTLSLWTTASGSLSRAYARAWVA
jgi:hypothetical protein